MIKKTFPVLKKIVSVLILIFYSCVILGILGVYGYVLYENIKEIELDWELVYTFLMVTSIVAIVALMITLVPWALKQLATKP